MHIILKILAAIIVLNILPCLYLVLKTFGLFDSWSFVKVYLFGFLIDAAFIAVGVGIYLIAFIIK